MIKRFLLMIFILAGIVSVFLFYVWERATSLQLTLILAKEQKKLELLENQVEELHMEYLKLTSVIRIERIAREQLGMRYPSSKEIQYIRIE
jgi:cell division protein FtsL